MVQQWQASQGQQELRVIMNGWYSASQEIVLGPARGVQRVDSFANPPRLVI
jgi:hypothetical protein